MTTEPELERPNSLWDDQPRWRGPRGTSADSWVAEIKAIKAAIEGREEQRHKDPGYRPSPMVAWRLDCLGDLLVVLEHNAPLL